jgi:acrosin
MGSAGFGAGANIETITVKGGSGGNTYNVSSFQSGSALKVFGGGGNDTLNFGVSNLAANITSMGAFLYDGQGGSDTFNINNSGSTAALTYTQGSGLVSVTGGSPTYSLSDASVEKLVINAGSAGDTFLVNAVPSGSQTILNGNAGLDGLVLGIATTNLDAIQGVVTYNTGADAGNLAANDTASAVSDIVHLTTKSLGAASGDTLFGPGGALFFDNLVNFGSFPGITLNLSTGADTVLAEPLPSARVAINGDNPTTTPGDTLRVSLATATGAVFTPNGTGAGTYSFSNAGALNYTGFESVVAAIPGDNDLNGTVNAADYNAWRASFGSVVPRGTGSDANGNGAVDAVDYVVWRHNLGKHTPGSGSGAATSEVAAVATDTGRQSVSRSRIDVSRFIAESNVQLSGVQPRSTRILTANLVAMDLLTDDESRDEFFNQLLLQSDSGRQLPKDTGMLNNLSWSEDSMTDADVSASKDAFAAFSDNSVYPSSMLRPRPTLRIS